MIVSIVMPTFNRKDILLKCLRHLNMQTFPKKDFEIIICDDGSTDGTKLAIKKFKKSSELNIKYIYSEHVGSSPVRNFGIKIAKGKYIALINDDMIPGRHWLEEHMKTHEKEKGVAVHGFVDWDSEIEISEFMHFIAPFGPEYDCRIKNWNNAGYRNFMTSNLTLERRWLKLEKFNEDIKFASCEDIDLGIRLEKHGLRVVYNPKAFVYHNHVYYEKPFYRKMFITGRDLNKMNKRFSEIFKPGVLELMKLVFSRFYFLLFFNKRFYWKMKCGFFYYLGYFSESFNKDIISRAIYMLIRVIYEFQESLQKSLGVDTPDILPLLRRR
ncbi:MAG: glycosyltransferase [Candidatus Aenigmarchaeota archaeon]|nr:glycosyltransferase [Candidatus Aenigmarchaeota archaeon]